MVHSKNSGSIRVLHNLFLKYCPKRLSSSYEENRALTQVAVLDHNANPNRLQATTKGGVKKENVQWSKVTENWVPVKKMEPKKHSFIQDIYKEFENVATGKLEKNEKLEEIPKNIAKKPKPSKEEVIARKKSRFQLNK